MNKGTSFQKRNVVNLIELINKIKEGEIKPFVYDEDKKEWVPEKIIKEFDVKKWGGKEVTGRDITQDISKIGDIYDELSRIRTRHLNSSSVSATAGQDALTTPISVSQDQIIYADFIVDTQTKIKLKQTHKYEDPTSVSFEKAVSATVEGSGAVTSYGDKLFVIGNESSNTYTVTVFNISDLSQVGSFNIALSTAGNDHFYRIAEFFEFQGYLYALFTVSRSAVDGAIVVKINPMTYEVVKEVRYPYGDTIFAAGMARVCKGSPSNGVYIVVVVYDEPNDQSLYWVLDTDLNSVDKFVGPTGRTPIVVGDAVYQDIPTWDFLVGYSNAGVIDVVTYYEEAPDVWVLKVVDTITLPNASYTTDIFCKPDIYGPTFFSLSFDTVYQLIPDYGTFDVDYFTLNTGGNELYAGALDDYGYLLIVDDAGVIYKLDTSWNLYFAQDVLNYPLYYPLHTYFKDGYWYIPSEGYQNYLLVVRSPSSVSTTDEVYLNAGADLYPNCLYTFTITASEGDTINFVTEQNCNLKFRLYIKG